MNTLRQRLLTGWNLMRVLRLGLSLWILVMAIQSQDITMAFLATFLALTAVSGVGCCGGNGCYTVPGKRVVKEDNDTDYEEIK